MESKFRSATKSVVWRIVGVLILAVITYTFTRSWLQTGLVTFLHHAIFLFVFYFHERLWLMVPPPKNILRRSIFKMFTYETLCGNIILGIITYLVTNDVAKMTYITGTYIGIKHVCYVANEFVWRPSIQLQEESV